MDSAIDPTGYQDDTSTNERQSAASTSTSSSIGGPGQTIEDDVKQLAGSITSWWSDFSRKSQQQINDVRAQIDAQGGLVSMAKREAAKFEAQLNDAQETARKNVTVDEATRKRQSVDLDGWGVAGTTSATEQDAEAIAAGKGKAKERQEGDDGADVERLEERARLKKERASGDGQRRSSDLAASTGEPLFDIDNTEHETSTGGEFKAIEDAAQTAMSSMQSFWDKIQTDPRVNKLQASVAKTLQDIKLPAVATATTDGAERDVNSSDGETATAKQSSLALPDLSEQFQTAFPKLDLKESQAMAKRYFEASQTAALDWTKEMGALMSDLVHVVPPEEANEKDSKKKTSLPASGGNSTAKADNTPSNVPSYAEAPAFTEEDDFDWDQEVEAESVDGLETTTGPQTASWDDDQVQTISEAEEASERAVNTTTRPHKKHEEDEEDSDWE